MPEKDNKENNKKKNPEEQKKEIAKTFGLNLEDIEHIKLDNGHEFFKFRDPKDQSIRMIENIDYGADMDSLFKGTQNGLLSAQTSDSKANARDIFVHNSNKKNMELTLLPISYIKDNKWKFKRMLRTLNTEVRTQIRFLLKNSKKIDLQSINLDYGFGVTKEGKIIDVHVDFINRRVNMEFPQVISYGNGKVDTDDKDYEVSNTNIDGIFKEFNLDGNTPTIEKPKNIEIDGETINTEVVLKIYEMPELIDRLEINSTQKEIYTRIVGMITDKLGKNKGTEKDNSRQLTLKNEHRNNTENKAA